VATTPHRLTEKSGGAVVECWINDVWVIDKAVAKPAIQSERSPAELKNSVIKQFI
jgi:hypothetical protein